VVEVSPAGEIKTLRPAKLLLVRTLGKTVAAQVAVVAQPPMANYPEPPRNNLIDGPVLQSCAD
jgi:hypothetical protein